MSTVVGLDLPEAPAATNTAATTATLVPPSAAAVATVAVNNGGKRPLPTASTAPLANNTMTASINNAASSASSASTAATATATATASSAADKSDDAKASAVNDAKAAAMVVDADPGKLMTLISKDKSKFPVSQLWMTKMSKLVQTSLESDEEADELPVPAVTLVSLELIVQYVVHHKGVHPAAIEKPLRSSRMEDVCEDKWDAKFIDDIGEDRGKLYDLILAANYMDIQSLLMLGLAKIASLIKGKPLEQYKEILAVKRSTQPNKPDPSSKSNETNDANQKAVSASASTPSNPQAIATSISPSANAVATSVSTALAAAPPVHLTNHTPSRSGHVQDTKQNK
jgi:S-phase kinase-associated protein 1